MSGCRDCRWMNWGRPLAKGQVCAPCPGRDFKAYPFADVQFTTPCWRWEARHGKPVLGREVLLALREPLRA